MIDAAVLVATHFSFVIFCVPEDYIQAVSAPFSSKDPNTDDVDISHLDFLLLCLGSPMEWNPGCRLLIVLATTT